MKLFTKTMIAATLLLTVLLCSSCTQKAETGNTVKVHYVCMLEDGTIVDSSRETGQPLEVVLGSGGTIPGFENAIIGMSLGERVTINLTPEEGYGPKRQDLIVQAPLDRMPPDMTPIPGRKLTMMQNQGGAPIEVTIVEVGDSTVTLDANHPLAGQALTFDIELVEIL